MAALTLRAVCKSYGRGAGRVTVIENLSAEIQAGEFVVIVGPSGCGKSTLLRLVAGLEEVDGGEICIAGRVVNRLEPSQRNIAMVFQNYALYPHMSVFQNMAYGLRMAGLDRKQIRERVLQVAQMLELSDLLERKPRQLSGGQRQRVAMGRAMVRQPSVFLFDEPLSNLDARLRSQTRIEMRRLHREFGITTLFVTHDQSEALTLAQRMIVMNAGSIEQMGTPAEVYRQPASIFVAGFIGAPPMNLLRGRLLADGLLLAPGKLLSLIGPAALSPAALDREVVLGVRPEQFERVAPGTGWRFELEFEEMLGAERLLYGRLANAPCIVREEVTKDPEGLLEGAKPGAQKESASAEIWLRPRQVHWFDAVSGRRLSGLPPTAGL